MKQLVAHFVGTKREFERYLKRMRQTALDLAEKADKAATRKDWRMYEKHMDAAVYWAKKANKLIK